MEIKNYFIWSCQPSEAATSLLNEKPKNLTVSLCTTDTLDTKEIDK